MKETCMNHKTGRWTTLWLAAAAGLWACAPDGTGTPNPQAKDRQKIIVEFAAPGEQDDTADVKAKSRGDAAARILARLDPGTRASARVLDILSVITLEADAETVMKLLRMPEVVALQPDHEVEIPTPPGTIEAPAVPPGKGK